MKIAIIGNRASCSYCQNIAKTVGTYPVPAKATAALKKQLADAAFAFRAWLASCSGCGVIDADKATAPALYNAYRAMSLTKPIAGMPQGKYNWPVVSVFDDAGTLKGSFVARNLPAVALIARIEALCPSCSEPAAPPAPLAVCPTCGGLGKVPAKKGAGK